MAGTDGFADADFAGAFGDRNEHNVHDADTAHNERNGGDGGHGGGEGVKELAGGLGNLGAREDGVVRFSFVVFVECFFDALDGSREFICGGGFDVDLLELESVLMEHFAGFETNDGSAIEVDVVVVDGLVGTLEDADNSEIVAADGEIVAYGLTGAKEVDGELRADNNSVGIGNAVYELTISNINVCSVEKFGGGSHD